MEAGESLEHDLSTKNLAASHALDALINVVANDILQQHAASQLRGTKYITHRAADASFMTAINDNEKFAAWNPILAQYLQYEMPILDGVPLEDLIDLRAKDYDAFLVYRDTLKGVIREHVAKRPAISGKEAAEIYDDVVRPELNKMNQKLKSVRDKLSSKVRRDVIIAGGIVALGLTSGLFVPGLAISAAAAAPFAVTAARAALERSDASDELRSENMSFLWRVAQKSGHN